MELSFQTDIVMDFHRTIFIGLKRNGKQGRYKKEKREQRQKRKVIKTKDSKKWNKKKRNKGEAIQFHSKTVGLILILQMYSISKKTVLKSCLNLSQSRQRTPVDC